MYKNVSVTAGSDEAMRLIFHCFGQQGKKLLTVIPTFEMSGIIILLNLNSLIGYTYGKKDVRKVLERAKEAGAIVEKLKNAGYKTMVLEGNYVLFLPKKDSRIIVEELKKKGKIRQVNGTG